MEYDYTITDDQPFVNVLPGQTRTLRVQTVPAASPRFHALHKAFEAATGCPVLVNTSFNGFSEPIVCSPRDAVRVFFGSGLDLLVLGRFVIRK
jgi:carbamoyltransferase